MNTSRLGRTVEKVKVTRVNNIFIMPNQSYLPQEKIIKDYIYSPQARIIA
ncbi:MAG: hypothetical protein AB7V50_00410 [Vampirovibrionia bacterium]